MSDQLCKISKMGDDFAPIQHVGISVIYDKYNRINKNPFMRT